ncbi:hypothetical protein HU200_053501 [Digitaria exilis]|uniref:NB-ARC domain-containing protein n=1 Tax=Digitaria exilis TaxID=1010633 RepID=A0A835E8D4_9POAL|nr:hypothetical protein HU200_053501 [Digitaria exilis]
MTWVQLFRRYLIVIDDLWSIEAWKTIECALVKNNNGSRVITTTRMHEVAKACCTGFPEHVYHMEPFSDLHSRWLFFKRVFGTEDSCPEESREISADMLRKCKGVPLAIISIASLLAIKTRHVDPWKKIFKSLGSELDTNPNLNWMRHVLSLSYNDLDHELKTCLLYLASYPEDYKIERSDLLKKWIAEGFIRERRGLELEEAAESRFNELINRSMIEPVYRYSDDVVSHCRVHDLMLDLIVSKCREENFVTIIDGQFISMNEASQARRISHQSGNRDIAQAVERMRGPHVRSYNSFPAADCIPPLSKFEHLRILDMMGRRSGTDPENMCVDLSAINELFLLRYLKISHFHLKLPNKFGELKHLMTLDIWHAHLYPRNQSSDFTSLSSLRDLSLPCDYGVVLMRNGLSKLCSLRRLWGFDLQDNSVECIRDLGELTNLTQLALHYSCPSHEEILVASLEKLGNSNLRRLSWYSEGETLSTQFWGNCFTHPRHLQRFFAHGSMPKIPKWMEHAESLAYLDRLRVEELKSDDLQVLAHLPCLVSLFLSATTVLEKHIIIHPNTFPSLKYFVFFCEPSSLMTFEKDAMPQLQDLTIHFSNYKQGSAVETQEGSPVAGLRAPCKPWKDLLGYPCQTWSKVQSGVCM